MIKSDKPKLTVVQGDYGYDLNFTLKDSAGTVVNITGGSLKLKAQKKGQTALAFNGTMTIVSGSAGTCKYTVVNGDFATAGEYYAEIELTLGGVVQTFQDFVIDCQAQLPRS